MCALNSIIEKEDSAQKAIRAIANGAIVVVSDDPNREGEGDLVMAAQFCSAEKMAFIIRHTAGIVCTPLTLDIAHRLELNPMVASNTSIHTTNFTVSVDYRAGLSTGISSEERASTCRALANSSARQSDFVRPGHIFPLIAQSGGVLIRAGHTEAAVDLCRLAQLHPVGVICELVNDDGTVMKGAQIERFARQHELVYIHISDIIRYRQAHEKLVKLVESFVCDSPIGSLRAHVYSSKCGPICHAAFVYGEIGDGNDIMVRFHRPDIVNDIFYGSETANVALERMRRAGKGVLVCLRDGAVGVPSSPPAANFNREVGKVNLWREVGVGAQILRDLGVRSIRNLSQTQRSYNGIAGFGIELLSDEPL